MGCAPSKQETRKRRKMVQKQELEISLPTNFRRNSASYPSTLCVECGLPSRTLLASLGNQDKSQGCNCDEGPDPDYDLKPISPLSPIDLFPRKELPTSYNFDFGFKENSDGFEKKYIEGYYDYDEADDDESDPSHKRYASFSSDQWKVDHKVVVTTQTVSSSRSNSCASSDCLGTGFDGQDDDKVPILDHTNLDNESFGPRLRIWGKLPFETVNQSSPDLLSAYTRQSQRVSKDQVKVVRILGSRSSNLI
ncbi:hypothetical protein ABW19_dt0209137 [Dactylella cylindrospora]|nr:hypothetical protein ABW19_dt0209137 [Dactylella cylindrospora]